MTDEKITVFDRYFPTDKPSRLEAIDVITECILATIPDICLKREELYLSLDEAITNAMEHGNKWDPQKKVHIQIIKQSNSADILITDEGRGFNHSETRAALKSRDVMSARGRGIFIINQFCSLTWNKSGNQIGLTIKRA